MNASHHINGTTRTLRTAAGFYVTPRAAILFLIVGTLGLAGFLVFLQIALVMLRPLGA